MSAQKVEYVTIQVTAYSVALFKFAIIALGVTLSVIKLANPKRGKALITIPDEIFMPLFIIFLVSAIVLFYLTFVNKNYNETGYVIIDEDKIEVYENYIFKETIFRSDMSNIKLGILEEPDENGELMFSGLSKLTFIANQKPFEFNLLFDRQQRMDEFYARFNIPAPAVVLI